MSRRLVRAFVIGGLVLTMPAFGFAQEATVTGTVRDATGGVLPGVTIVAVHEQSGNRFETVTDTQGVYRLPVRTGAYRLTAELSGFVTTTQTGLELLLAQEAVVNFQMKLSGVEESVTVTGEAPLVDVTQTRAGGNIDPRQMQELPINGRNWMTLTMLAPGSRANAVGDTPVETVAGPTNRQTGDFQINLDGQQVTNNIMLGGTWSEPKFSRDAIAEFEFVTNRFDATQGRSNGTQVNLITKSGTNILSGTLSGYFRSDKFNAEDFVARRVLPYSNQQISSTFGGPIKRDRIHYFLNYEFEREPTTFIFTSPYPRFNLDRTSKRIDHKGLFRVDTQLSSSMRFMVRGTMWDSNSPYTFPNGFNSATRHPSTASQLRVKSEQLSVNFNQIVNNRSINEIKAGFAGSYRDVRNTVDWPGSILSGNGLNNGAPSISLLNYSIGGGGGPNVIGQDNWSIRDDFHVSFTKGGRHNIKTGGEYIYIVSWYLVGARSTPTIDALGGPIPGNIEDLFPVWNDVSTWNLAALSPITRSYTFGVGNMKPTVNADYAAVWFQDDWNINDRLTLNLGVRGDFNQGAFGDEYVIEPFLLPGRDNDRWYWAPRFGFAYKWDDRTVMRGGVGQFYGEVSAQTNFGPRLWSQSANVFLLNDRRPDFAANPTVGPVPTLEQAQQQLCSVAQRPGCIRLNITSNFPSPEMQFPYSYQGSIGVQRQVADSMAFDVDYVYTAGREELFTRNINLSYNPATGANYPFTDVSRRPYPDWGVVVPWLNGAESTYHGLQTSFTKRMSQRWQASATYLLSGLWNVEPAPDVGFTLAPDFGGENTLAVTDQRHRFTFNGIWQLPYDFELSGLYFFGSGQRFATVFGGDRRGLGTTITPGASRLRPDGTVVPRNDFVGRPVHRVDLRAQRRFRLVGRASIDGIVEVFNVFNHANFGAYQTAEINRATYGQPTQHINLAYAPRMLQMGFRFAF